MKMESAAVTVYNGVVYGIVGTIIGEKEERKSTVIIIQQWNPTIQGYTGTFRMPLLFLLVDPYTKQKKNITNLGTRKREKDMVYTY